MTRRVVIDCFSDCLWQYRDGWAVVAVDVIRATTTAMTAVALGRRCIPASSLPDALERAACLERPLLVGELGGNMPFGFDMNNSPAQLARRPDVERPMVLLATSGTPLILNARGADAVYLGGFRNYGALAGHLAGRHERIAVVGAGSRREFREEDQMACAWISEGLLNAGYAAADPNTVDLVGRWSGSPPDACFASNSVRYLRRSGQMEDLEFILAHVNDLSAACVMRYGEVALAPAAD